jgi:hypothetical protein
MNVRSKGRPVVDQEWNLILKRCSDVLPHEEMDNEHLVEEWQTQGTSPHGCYIRPGQQSKALDKVLALQNVSRRTAANNRHRNFAPMRAAL